ncbi:MAG: hypothetical protein V3R66_03390 [Rhodospirillales bacterium]
MATTQALMAQQGASALKGMTAKTAAGSKAATAGSAIFSGKGLGLGLGLGGWGPVILGIVGAAAVYGYIRSRNVENAQSDEELELADILAER